MVTSPAWTPIAVRLGESNDRKVALGRTLATLLRPKQFVYIDVGSVNLAFARMLPDDLPLTVPTHDPAIAACVMGRPGIKLLLTGGSVNPEIGAALRGRAGVRLPACAQTCSYSASAPSMRKRGWARSMQRMPE